MKAKKLTRIKGKNGKAKGSFRFYDGKRSVNTGTKDADEAIKRQAGYFAGTWTPPGEPDPTKDLAAAAAVPPPPAPEPEPEPAPAAPPADASGISAAAALNDAAQAEAPAVAKAADGAEPAAHAQTSLNEILESVGIKPDEIYMIGGRVVVDAVVWLEGKGIERMVGVAPPPLPYDQEGDDGKPTQQAQLATLVRTLGASGIAAEGKRWAPNLGEVPPLAVAGVAVLLLGVMQYAAARELVAAQKAAANKPREVRHEQPEPAAAAA